MTTNGHSWRRLSLISGDANYEMLNKWPSDREGDRDM